MSTQHLRVYRKFDSVGIRSMKKCLKCVRWMWTTKTPLYWRVSKKKWGMSYAESNPHFWYAYVKFNWIFMKIPFFVLLDKSESDGEYSRILGHTLMVMEVEMLFSVFERCPLLHSWYFLASYKCYMCFRHSWGTYLLVTQCINLVHFISLRWWSLLCRDQSSTSAALPCPKSSCQYYNSIKYLIRLFSCIRQCDMEYYDWPPAVGTPACCCFLFKRGINEWGRWEGYLFIYFFLTAGFRKSSSLRPELNIYENVRGGIRASFSNLIIFHSHWYFNLFYGKFFAVIFLS